MSEADLAQPLNSIAVFSRKDFSRVRGSTFGGAMRNLMFFAELLANRKL